MTDLVVWNQNPQQVDIIELRGDIQLDKIALLSRALNLKGLNSLAALSSNADTYESYKHFNDFPDMNPGAISQHIRQMMENLHNHMGSGSLFGDFSACPVIRPPRTICPAVFHSVISYRTNFLIRGRA